MTLVIGIDPGLGGAVSFLRTSDHACHVYDMPTRMKANGRRELNLHYFSALCRRYIGRFGQRLAIVEGVHSMPRDGAIQAFAFGKATGGVLGVLAGLEVPTLEVRPAVWKALMGVTADKNTSRAMAQKLFPRYAEKFKRVKDDGRAEAALMAQYGVQQFL